MEKMRVALFPFEPFVFPCALTAGLQPTKECRLPGLHAEILNAIFRYANLKPELLKFDNGDGSFLNGRWSGFWGYVLNGSIDTAAVAYIGTEYRRNYFDFGFPITETKPVFLTSKKDPGVFHTIMLVFNVFGPMVWASLLVCLLVTILIIMILRVAADPRMARSPIFRGSFGNALMCVAMRNNSVKFFVALLGFTSLLFVGLYRGALLTQLLHPVHIDAFSDSMQMMNLIKQGKVKIVVETHSHWYLQVMQESNETYFRRLREALKDNPIVVERNFSALLDMIEEGDHIYPLAEDFARYLIRDRCNLDYISGHDLPSYWLGYIFRENFPLSSFDLAVLMTEGVRVEIARRYFTPTVKCKIAKENEKIEGGQPLTFLALCGAFLLLITGFLFGLVWFLTEKFLCWERLFVQFPHESESRKKSLSQEEAVEYAIKLKDYMNELRLNKSSSHGRLELLETVLSSESNIVHGKKRMLPQYLA